MGNIIPKSGKCVHSAAKAQTTITIWKPNLKLCLQELKVYVIDSYFGWGKVIELQVDSSGNIWWLGTWTIGDRLAHKRIKTRSPKMNTSEPRHIPQVPWTQQQTFDNHALILNEEAIPKRNLCVRLGWLLLHLLGSLCLALCLFVGSRIGVHGFRV